MRRTFDIVCAVIGVVCLSPLLAIIALAIKLGDGGPVLYSQLRVGKNFQKFPFHKFRSMVLHADCAGSPVTGPRDFRITRVGKLLRKYKLDELPQLVNVLKGDIQLVGARPEIERYVEMFRSQYALLLQDRPGITDPATLTYRHEEEFFNAEVLEGQYVSQILPDKLRLSLEYQHRRTFRSDVAILFRTVLGCDFRRRDSKGSRKSETSQSYTST